MTDDCRIQIYQSPDGETCVDVRFEQDTVWLTQAQMVELFNRDVSVISRHIKMRSGKGKSVKKAICKKCKLLLPTNRLPFMIKLIMNLLCEPEF